jgi:hypothetical protein
MQKLGSVLIIAALCGGLPTGGELPRLFPPAAPIDYDRYATPDLIPLAGALLFWHRPAEALAAGEEALTRRLEPAEDAAIRHTMARSYESLPDGGPAAKKMYEEVLRLHPAYERNIEIAYRLGELNSGILLAGTTPDPNRAVECFQYVLDKSESLKTKPENVHYIALKAHMALGILDMQKGKLAGARTHFEAIYRCRTHWAEPLPCEVFRNPKELFSHKAWLRKQISGMKTRIPAKLVGVCLHPQLGDSLVELGHLAVTYADDPNVMEPLRQTVRRITEVDKVLDEAIEKGAPRPRGNQTKP